MTSHGDAVARLGPAAVAEIEAWARQSLRDKPLTPEQVTLLAGLLAQPVPARRATRDAA